MIGIRVLYDLCERIKVHLSPTIFSTDDYVVNIESLPLIGLLLNVLDGLQRFVSGKTGKREIIKDYRRGIFRSTSTVLFDLRQHFALTRIVWSNENSNRRCSNRFRINSRNTTEFELEIGNHTEAPSELPLMTPNAIHPAEPARYSELCWIFWSRHCPESAIRSTSCAQTPVIYTGIFNPRNPAASFMQ